MTPAWRMLHLHEKPYEHGEHVEDAQRLLVHGRFLPPSAIDGQYGPVTAHAVHQAKWSLGYAPKDVNTTFGPYLQQLLSGVRKASPMMRARAKLRKRSGGREAGLRASVVSWARWACVHEREIHYSQGPHRMDGIGRHALLPLYTDCSSSHTIFHNWAGAPDPNGLNFNHTGFTGTILANCKPIAKDHARGGDGVVFGDGSGHHVCTVVEGGSDPLLVSHGQEGGPFLIRFSAEHEAQARMGHGTVRWVTLPKW